MKAIERAKGHFAEQEIKQIEVPEWADEHGKPLVIYAKPLTLAETSKLYKMSKQDSLEMMAFVLIYKALNEDMEKMFNLGDKQDLLNNVDREVLVSVAQQIMGEETLEETKKN